MFQYLLERMRYLQLSYQNSQEERYDLNQTHTELSSDLIDNLEHIKNILGSSYDFVIREFNFGSHSDMHGALLFLVGLSDQTLINESILKPLMLHHTIEGEVTSPLSIEVIRTRILTGNEVQEVTSIEEVLKGCLAGQTILLADGLKEGLQIVTVGPQTRKVEEPKTETVVRGPREGFTESILVNTTLLRRKIKNPNLILETLKLGKQTQTTVCIAYIKGIVNPKLIQEIHRRLSRIHTDAILESGYIEQFIEDAPFSLFSTLGNSEKPDAVAAKILEGRAAIFIDGTPFVLTAPMLFIESFQSSEDYYSRPYYASLIRTLRYISYLITTLAPATYVALSSFHQELLPTALLFTMVAAEEGIPFPSLMEALMMGIVFEILREAGVRLPRPVGQAVSIVGALVIGESAVKAGIVGEPMVIVVALTAVSGFVVPSQSDSAAFLRILFTLLAGTLGIFGIMIGFLGLFIHLASLRSFGTPYLSPIAPLSPADLKDTFLRAPLWMMLTRPRVIGWNDPQRQAFRLEPHSPSEEKKSLAPKEAD